MRDPIATRRSFFLKSCQTQKDIWMRLLMVLVYTWIGCMCTTIEAVTTTSTVEFQFTNEEERMLGQWKTKSYDDLTQDALKGNAAALHLIGGNLLYGLGGMTINVSDADIFFSHAACLGFAPSLDKVRAMYMEEKSDLFLSLVYTNLVIAFGHPEYTIPYLTFRMELVNKLGAGIADEIERLAMKKKEQILENKKTLEQAEDKIRATTEIMIKKNIVSEDRHYGTDYWMKFAQLPTQVVNSEDEFTD